jgi:hypothetical protein
MPRTSSSSGPKRPVTDRSKHRAQIQRTFLDLAELVAEGWDIDYAADREAVSITITISKPNKQNEPAAAASARSGGDGSEARARNHARVRANTGSAA